MDTDVLVIGAGPVGLTLANELTRHGARSRVIDRASGIREVSKAMILHVRTQEVLDKVGIAGRAAREAEPLREVVVHAYGKHIGSWDLDDIDSPYRHPLIIGQNRSQHMLLDRLAEQGGAVEWNTEALSFTMTDDAVSTVLGTGETVTSRFIVGCEGSNSLVRKTLGLTFDGERYTGEQFIQADCRIKWALPSGRSYLFLTADGYMMVIEFPNGLVRIFISLPDRPGSAGAAEAAAQLGAVESADQPALDDIRHHLERLTGYGCELSDPVWLARYRTSHRYAGRFGQGRAFIAGDAGHVHVPIGGQGMNTGIQDAFNLGWKLAGAANGTLRPEILESYGQERHPVAEGLIRGTNFAYTGILHPSQLKQHAARLFGPFLINNSHVRGFMRDTLEELRISYPDSPLNLDLGGTKGPKPGERVLDAPLVRADDGATVSLNALTRGTAWTLLLFGDDEGLGAAVAGRYAGRIVACPVAGRPEATPGLFIDALHLAHDRYGIASPAFYLLRPDTYVAARGPMARRDALFAYLERVFA